LLSPTGSEVEATVRDRAARETECCSFFTFVVVRRAATLFDLEVTVPTNQVEVLDALTVRVSAILATR
jgi:hypothetical protein